MNLKDAVTLLSLKEILVKLYLEKKDNCLTKQCLKQFYNIILLFFFKSIRGDHLTSAIKETVAANPGQADLSPLVPLQDLLSFNENSVTSLSEDDKQEPKDSSRVEIEKINIITSCQDSQILENLEEKSQPCLLEDSQVDLFECGTLSGYGCHKSQDGTGNTISSTPSNLQHQILRITLLSCEDGVQNTISPTNTPCVSQAAIEPDKREGRNKILIDKDDVLSHISSDIASPITTHYNQKRLGPSCPTTVPTQLETETKSIIHISDSGSSNQISKSLSLSTSNARYDEAKECSPEAELLVSSQTRGIEMQPKLTCQTLHDESEGGKRTREYDHGKKSSSQSSDISSVLVLTTRDVPQEENVSQDTWNRDVSHSVILTNTVSDPHTKGDNDAQLESMLPQEMLMNKASEQMSESHLYNVEHSTLSKNEISQRKKKAQGSFSRKVKTEAFVHTDHEKKMSYLHRFDTLCDQIASCLNGDDVGGSLKEPLDIESHMQRCECLMVKMHSMQKEEKTKLCLSLKDTSQSKQKKKCLKKQLELLKSRHEVLMSVVMKHGNIKTRIKKNKEPQDKKWLSLSQESLNSKKRLFYEESWEDKATNSNARSDEQVQFCQHNKDDDRCDEKKPKSFPQVENMDTTECVIVEKIRPSCVNVQENQVSSMEERNKFDEVIIYENSHKINQKDYKVVDGEMGKINSVVTKDKNDASEKDDGIDDNVTCVLNGTEDITCSSNRNTSKLKGQTIEGKLVANANRAGNIPQKRPQSAPKFQPPAKKQLSHIRSRRTSNTPNQEVIKHVGSIPWNLGKDKDTAEASNSLDHSSSLSSMKGTSICVDNILFTEFPDPSCKSQSFRLDGSQRLSDTLDKKISQRYVKNISQHILATYSVESESQAIAIASGSGSSNTLPTVHPSVQESSTCIDSIWFTEYQDPSFTKSMLVKLVGLESNACNSHGKDIVNEVTVQALTEPEKHPVPDSRLEDNDTNNEESPRLSKLPVCTSSSENIQRLNEMHQLVFQTTASHLNVPPVSAADVDKRQDPSLSCSTTVRSLLLASSKEMAAKCLKHRLFPDFDESFVVDEQKHTNTNPLTTATLCSSQVEQCNKIESFQQTSYIKDKDQKGFSDMSTFPFLNKSELSSVTSNHCVGINSKTLQNCSNSPTQTKSQVALPAPVNTILPSSFECLVEDFRPASPCSTQGSSLFPVPSKEIVRRMQSTSVSSKEIVRRMQSTSVSSKEIVRRMQSTSVSPPIPLERSESKSGFLKTSTAYSRGKENDTKKAYSIQLTQDPINANGIRMTNQTPNISILQIPAKHLNLNESSSCFSVSAPLNLEPTPASLQTIMTSSLCQPTKTSTRAMSPKAIPKAKKSRKKLSKTETQFTQTSPELSISRFEQNDNNHSIDNHNVMVKELPVNVHSVIKGLKTIHLIADQELASSDIPVQFWNEDFAHITMSRFIWDSVVDW